jgi:tRNA pseudouridine38-40 synthase
MREAVSFLPGVHDFAAFQAAGGTARTTVREISRTDLSVNGPELILTISGNAFLYNMVRIIAGTLVEAGLHKRNTDAFVRAFSSLNRLDLGMTAPACGLELTEVRYPEKAFIDPASLRWHEEE